MFLKYQVVRFSQGGLLFIKRHEVILAPIHCCAFKPFPLCPFTIASLHPCALSPLHSFTLVPFHYCTHSPSCSFTLIPFHYYAHQTLAPLCPFTIIYPFMIMPSCPFTLALLCPFTNITFHPCAPRPCFCAQPLHPLHPAFLPYGFTPFIAFTLEQRG